MPDQPLAQIIADSVCPATGCRITTFRVQLWTVLQAELNTHRALSRNSSSSRAISMATFRRRAGFTPMVWGRNQRGMQADQGLSGLRRAMCRLGWELGRAGAKALHWGFEKMGLHKQVSNRILAPFSESEIIITATEWNGFFAQRLHRDAQPEIRAVAEAMYEAMLASQPQELEPGQWHLPFVDQKESSTAIVAVDCEGGVVPRVNGILCHDGAGPAVADSRCVSAARCARASYLLPDGKEPDLLADLALFDRLVQAGHWSPLEHQAQALHGKFRSGNFVGWRQFRKDWPGEDNGDYRQGQEEENRE